MNHRRCKLCGKPSGLQSWCNEEHYARWMAGERPKPLPRERVCAYRHCQQEFTVDPAHPHKSFCSTHCADKERQAKARDRRGAKPDCGRSCWFYTTCVVRVWSPEFEMPCFIGSRYHGDYVKRYPKAEVTA